MYIPEGYTEKQVIDTITKVLQYLSPNYSFGYYDEDDMAQEGFIFAMEAMPRFDQSKNVSLQTFISRHVRNRFLNMLRNKLFRYTPPCLECEKFDVIKGVCVEHDSRCFCERWNKWESRNDAKRSLMEFSDGHTAEEETFENDMHVIVDGKELLEYVSERISLCDRADFIRFIEGAKLKKSRRVDIADKIREIVRERTEDMSGGTEEDGR